MLVTGSHFQPRLIFAGKISWLIMVSAFSEIIRLGWLWLKLTNILDYFGMKLITTVKIYKIHALSVLLSDNFDIPTIIYIFSKCSVMFNIGSKSLATGC